MSSSNRGHAIWAVLAFIVGALGVYFLCPRLVGPIEVVPSVWDMEPEQYWEVKSDVRHLLNEEVTRAMPGDPAKNPCNWPEHCAPTAREMLHEIRGWVATAPIEDPLRMSIDQQVDHCLSPLLKNTQGEHVCGLQEPDPCEELKEIHTLAKSAHENNDAEQWEEVHDDLFDYPGGRAD